MGKETIQPTRIDREEYERFKRYVEEVHGGTRGHLKKELENALRDYRQPDDGQGKLARIENDVATLISMVDEARIKGELDGGTTEPAPSQSQSAPPRGNSKPEINRPRNEKIEYMIDELLDQTGATRDSGEVPKSEIDNIIQTEYNFKPETVAEYKEQIVSSLQANEHPRHGQTVAWGNRYDDIVDELREKADDEMNDL
jgi:hypothetical protein